MATGKKRGAIKPFFGGNLLVYPISNPDSISIASTASWVTLSHLEKAVPVIDIAMNPEYNEKGKKIIALEGEENAYIDGIFKQRDKDLLEFLGDECRDNYYAIYRDMGTVDGKRQELFIPLAKFKPGFDLGAAPPKPPFRIEILNSGQAVTIASGGMPTGAAATTATIAAGTLYEITET